MKIMQDLISDNAGFSLIETLVAVFILSVVSLISLNVMSNFADANQAMTQKMSHMNEIASARTYLRTDLSQTFDHRFSTSPSAEKNGEVLLKFTRGSSEFAAVDLSKSSAETIEYRFDGNALIRRTFERPDPTQNTPFMDYVILKDVTNVTLKYYDGFVWREDWTPGIGSQKTTLPRAVELSWQLQSEDREPTYSYRNVFQVGVRQ
jgi:general secretion pathway protein J|tara:strand:+ start:71634 stop:72251 length:618 start_codon:yes stop_codon:yes gene_type:complete